MYARFGLAVYIAQCIETGLVNLLVALKLKDRHKITRADIVSFRENNYEKTLGTLITYLRQSMNISDDFEKELREALEIRNYLVHRYFRVNAIDFSNENGRIRMLSEINSYTSGLEQLDKKIDSICLTIGEQHGITEEMINKIESELLKEA